MNIQTHPKPSPALQPVSPRPNALERLRTLYQGPGPFVSYYAPCGDIASVDPVSAFAHRSDNLIKSGATPKSIAAIDARLRQPVPEHAGGWGIHATADGATVAEFAAEGPLQPLAQVAQLPMVAPMLEWEQWRIPHAMVTLTPAGSEVISFVPGEPSTIVPGPLAPAELAFFLRQLTLTDRLRLLVVVGDQSPSHQLVTRLRGMVPPDTKVVKCPSGPEETIADFTVRHVADVVARDSVRALEDFRFFEAGGRTVQGSLGAFAALASGRGQRLLIHDDPRASHLASFGTSPFEVSALPDHYPNQARRADVALWSAVSQGIAVRVVPSTSATGPDENIAVTLVDHG